MNMKKLHAAALAAALCLAASAAGAMTQKEFIELCRTGSASEVALALKDTALSAERAVDGVTPLMRAASAAGKTASVEKLQQLIAAGAKVNAADKAGRTPLMYAAEFSDDPEIVRTLLAAGAAIQQKDRERRRGWSALSYAAARNHNADIVNALIDAGANVNAPAGDGRSPLMLALEGKNTKDVVMALLDAGANPAAVDRSRRNAGAYLSRSALKNDADVAAAMKGRGAVKPVSPARFAQVCRTGSLARLNALLKAGNDANLTVDGLTPLMWAAKDTADERVVKALIGAGADVNAVDPEGRTALMYAAGKNAAAVRELMNAGARADLTDKDGKSVLDYAGEGEAAKIPALKAAAASLTAAKAARESEVNEVKTGFEKKLNDEFALRSAKEKALAETEAKLADLTKQLEAEKAARAADADAAKKAADAAKAEADAKAADLTKQLEAEKAARTADTDAAEAAKAEADAAKKAAADAEAKIAELTKKLEAVKDAPMPEAAPAPAPAKQ
ncbi:MAG: ankyrin repeat domain-containing protein [Pyramidobacter sp.]|nr:ankyrin repeat domain-containing protein [Pyramidobacter sp.]